VERGQDSEENLSMASIVEQMDAERTAEEPGRRVPRRGEIVEGTIASIDRDGILIDVGGKSDGTVPVHEIAELMQSENPPKVGDQVLAYVLASGDREGRMLLSLRQGEVERAWRSLEQLFNSGQVIEAKVTESNKGGVIVDALGLRGFVPISQLSGVRHDATNEEQTVERLAAIVGQSLPLKVVEINRRRNRLILSERLASQERRGQRKDELIAELQEGEIRRGRVTSVTDFGAFVDIGGADGLVHLSELSWTRVGRPSDVLNVGDEIDVMVISVDRERKKIGLSLRRTQPEPWAAAAGKYQPGDIVEGTITRIAAFGAFARIEDGIEGLIHISELGEGHIANPRQAVQEGERHRMRVLRVEPDRRRLGLSLRHVDHPEQPEEQPADPYSAGNYSSGSYSYGGDYSRPTIGDAFGNWQEQNADQADEQR
jgi:small subunit ribosomal protein S1